MADIESQKLLYHLTPLKNLYGILKSGLMPRAELADFEDIADSEILRKRRALGLENYVPFHWFARNPFDGGVQKARPSDYFIIFAVWRSLARDQGWKVIPRHPLANDDIDLLEYDEGFAAIDWASMNQREYHNAYCKSVCMAECLSPKPVPMANIFKIFVPDAKVEKFVMSLLAKRGLQVGVAVNRAMFLK